MIIHILKLIRWKNLLIIALTQYMMRWCVVWPLIKYYTINHYSHARGTGEVLTFDFNLHFSELHFFMLVMATVFIAAAGYVINDYFDRKTDILNRPDEVIIEKHISRRTAMGLHIGLNIAGAALGLYISYIVGVIQLSFIFVLVPGLLWYYSTSYKKQFLIGNLIVALMAALVPFIVPVFEVLVLNYKYEPTLLNYQINFLRTLHWAGGFAFFAFLTTLIREIIKDMEDMEGDNAYGCNTLPIVLGMNISKAIVSMLILLAIVLLTYIQFYYFPQHLEFRFQPSPEMPWYMQIRPDLITLWYFILFLFVPFAILIYQVLRSTTVGDYTLASKITKGIMLLGILYAPIVCFTFLNYQIILN